MSDVDAGPKLFLVPVGRENEHQRTIDGESPVGSCWGFTDGNYLAGRTKQGDMLLFIRAGSKSAPATIYRLGLVEQLSKNPDLASQLYKTQHNYSMGGKRKRDVPFTWIVKLKKVLPISWDKKAFLLNIGISDKDPILSARPATLASGKNAYQASQILQKCQALLASHPGLNVHLDNKTTSMANVHVNNKQLHHQVEEPAAMLPVVTSLGTTHSLCSSTTTASNSSHVKQCSNLSQEQPASCKHALAAVAKACMNTDTNRKQQLKAPFYSSEMQSVHSHQPPAASQDSQISVTDNSDSDSDTELKAQLECSPLPHPQRSSSYGIMLPACQELLPSTSSSMLMLTHHLAAKYGLQWVLQCSEGSA